MFPIKMLLRVLVSAALILAATVGCSVQAQTPVPLTPPATVSPPSAPAATASEKKHPGGAATGLFEKMESVVLLPFSGVHLNSLEKGRSDYDDTDIILNRGGTFAAVDNYSERDFPEKAGCSGDLQWEGNVAHGQCTYIIPRRQYVDNSGRGSPELIGPQRFSFSFRVKITRVEPPRVYYDLEEMCEGSTCYANLGQCSSTPSRTSASDCTSRRVRAAFTKATKKSVDKFMDDAKATWSRINGAEIALYMDGRIGFGSDDCDGSTWSPSGAGMAVNLRGLQGFNYDEPCPGRQKLEAVQASDGALAFRWVNCTKCLGQGTHYAFLPQSRNDAHDSRFDLILLIPAAKDTGLLERTRHALTNATKESLESAGIRETPKLFIGNLAQRARATSEIFYSPSAGSGSEDLARKYAALLSPVLGKVSVQPWPGETIYGVTIVVGAEVGATTP